MSYNFGRRSVSHFILIDKSKAIASALTEPELVDQIALSSELRSNLSNLTLVGLDNDQQILTFLDGAELEEIVEEGYPGWEY